MESEIQPVQVPLLEAVIEIRFPGEARIEVCRADYQDLIRADFPVLAVPLANPAQAPALQHYRFVNTAGTEFVGLAVNSFAHSTKEYPGWDSFRDSSRKYWESIPGFTPRSISRVGLRYINRFDGDMLNNIIVDDKNGLYGPILINPALHRSLTVLAAGENALVINIEWVPQEKRVTLDFDCFAENVEVEDLWDVVENLHEGIETHFFSLLTPEYRNQLQPTEGSNGSA